MNAFFSPKKLMLSDYGTFGVLVFGFLAIATLLIYLIAHFYLNHNVAFQQDEIASLLRMVGMEALITLCFLFVLFMVEKVEAKKTQLHLKKIAPKKSLLAASAIFIFLNVGAQSKSVVMREAATGLQTKAQILSTAKTKMIMNGEVLGHTQIPLGEKFTIQNEGVSGFVEKDKMVSIGCSLKITDQKGKIMLQMTDLFADNQAFNRKDSKVLKCIVSTGKPMSWDKRYDVTVVFWDKWGKGKITNQVTIETIDIP